MSNNTYQPVSDVKNKQSKKVVYLVITLASILIVTAAILFWFVVPIIRCNNFIKDGDSFMESKDYSEAVKAYDSALKIKNNNEKAKTGLSEAYKSWGESLASESDYENAVSVLDEGYEKTNNEEILKQKADVLNKYVDFEIEEGDKNLDNFSYEAANSTYEKAIELDPENENAYLGLIEILIRTNKFDEALDVAQKAYDKIGGDRIKESIEMLKSGNITASNGWIMKYTYYNSDGEVVYTHELEYNLKGNKSKIIWSDGNGNYMDSIDIEYDEKDRQITSYTYSTGTGTLNKIEIEYEEDECIETHYVGTTDEIDEYNKISFNDDGKVAVSEKYNSNWEYSGKIVDEYNEKGDLIKYTHYNSSDEIWYYCEIEYDDNGKKLKESEYDGFDELKSYRVFEYNSNGKLIKETKYDKSGEVDYVVDYE